VAELRRLANSLSETVSEKDELLRHRRVLNQKLFNRQKELEARDLVYAAALQRFRAALGEAAPDKLREVETQQTSLLEPLPPLTMERERKSPVARRPDE
jgi:hypothetical protein